jgi:hypothetical protein
LIDFGKYNNSTFGCATYFGTIWKRSLTRVFKNIIFFMFLNRFDVLISKIIKKKQKKSF